MLRKEVFEERAFFPIDLSGNAAMTSDDVKIIRTGTCVNLPRDLKKRTVLYIDASKRRPDTTPSRRTIFFLLQCVMENEASRKDTFVMLANISNPFAGSFVPSNVKCLKYGIAECMPIKDYRIHMIHIPPADTRVDNTFINTSKCKYQALLSHTVSLES